MLANIYLHAFDEQVQARGLGLLVRYADDFVIMCRIPGQAEAALAGARDILGSLGLEPRPGAEADHPLLPAPVAVTGGDEAAAAARFRQIDYYLVRRLFCLQVKKRGPNLHAGVAEQWTGDWFNDHGLYRLRGTVRYQKAA